ncbi:MAG: NACHT domain-containing protein [Nostocales cyanobacterium]|nr:MAG: NACHT domain-containing protein [Nostocales cyanobacterium]
MNKQPKQRNRGIAIKPEGLALIENKMSNLEYDNDKLAEVTGISIDTVNALFQGEKKDKKTIQAIAKALELKPTDIVDADEWYRQSKNTTHNQTDNDEWLQVCHTKLENQQQEIRRKASAMGFELDFPPVPLGLVERKQQQRRDEDVDRRDVYQLEKEVIAKIYEHNDFLEQVINQNPTGKNKHIAIVGEPGAGKTTLLSAVASYIKQENKELPIFISLGSLEKMTLEKYLLEKWLPHAMRLVNPDFKLTSEIEEQLKSRFYKGGVWLLLDGVDEMGESSPTAALNKISQALTDWLGQARVVLTCRLNVWDASLNNNNELSGFDTYKTQEFKPEDVDKFIEEWFKCDEDKIQRGEELKAKLREPGKERIYELVTNPLRLSLLCQIFYQNKHSDLPETKAELFGLYTRHFYDWKRELVPQEFIDSDDKQQELHQALGRLALAGINKDVRFRLNKRLAVEVMTERLFKLADKVGWLNLVDRDTRTEEAVYAFFHPNFQEYFAALVIDDWHYFLNHNNANPNPWVQHNDKNCVYLIFEDKWKEVILLWMGRQDILHKIKDEFMLEMSKFEDGCNFEGDCANIWKYNLFPIAKDCLQEFTDSYLNTVVYKDEDEVVREFDQVWKSKSDYYDWILRYELDCMRSSSQREEIRKYLINKLGIWMHYSAEEDDDFGFHTFLVMYNEYENNKTIIKQLEIDFQDTVYWINTSKTPKIIDLLSSTKHKFIKGAIINRLIQIFSEDNTEVANIYTKINSNLNDENDDFLESLIYILHQSGYYDDLEIVKICMQILNKSRNKTTIMAALDYLYDISCDHTAQVNVIKEIVSGLNKKYFQFLFNKNCKDRYWYCYEILLNCSSSMTYPEFYRAWHGEPPLNNLENQFTDNHSLLSQLQPTQKTGCIPIINTANLQLSDNEHEIAKSLCTRIWKDSLNLPAKSIPKISDVADLERELLIITEEVLQKQNLALVFNEIEPNATLINICRKLANAGEIHIALITKQPLDAPLKGFLPNQTTLLSAIQTWISEIA